MPPTPSRRDPLPPSIQATGALAILRDLPARVVRDVGAALYEAGIGAVEVTADSPDYLRSIEGLRAACPELDVGCGTVVDQATVHEAVAAGANFLVTPNVDFEVIEASRSRGVPIIVGAFTATEALGAHRAGAAAVKLFPAGPAGPSYLRALRQPLSEILFVATGGIDGDNAADFLRAGAAAVAVGGWLAARGDSSLAAHRAALLLTSLSDAGS